MDQAVDHERRPRGPGQPWVMVCMVMSMDGSTVVDGHSSGLSHPVDAAYLGALRSRADMILVGAGTVRAEEYGPPRRVGQQIVVVSRSASLDVTTPLFTSGAGVLALPEDAPSVAVPNLRAGRGTVDLAALLGQLDAQVVQAEGGAMLNGTLAELDLIDELNVTLAPFVSGGDGSRLTRGAPPLAHRLHLAQVAEHEDFVFMRWLRQRS